MKAIVTALALAAAITTASAQRTPPTPAQMAEHQVEHYTHMLSLTSAQQQEATAFFTAAAASESTLRTEQRTAHEAIAAAIKTGDTAAISQAATTLGQLEGELASAHALAEAKLYKLLTPDQQTKYASMMDRPMGMGMGRGHGGPGGPGGPDGPPPE